MVGGERGIGADRADSVRIQESVGLVRFMSVSIRALATENGARTPFTDPDAWSVALEFPGIDTPETVTRVLALLSLPPLPDVNAL